MLLFLPRDFTFLFVFEMSEATATLGNRSFLSVILSFQDMMGFCMTHSSFSYFLHQQIKLFILKRSENDDAFEMEFPVKEVNERICHDV